MNEISFGYADNRSVTFFCITFFCIVPPIVPRGVPPKAGVIRHACLIILLLLGTQAFGATPIALSTEASAPEREVIRRLFADEIADAESIGTEPVSIPIGLVDLNGDGKPEILAFLEQYPYFCGQHGCRFIVLVSEPSGWRPAVVGLVADEEVAVSGQRTHGYADLLLGSALLQWDGHNYQLVKPQPR